MPKNYSELRSCKGTLTSVNTGLDAPGVVRKTDYYTDINLGCTQSGAKDPNWRDRVARGDNASTNYDVMYRWLTPGGVSISAVPGSPGANVTFQGIIGGMDPYSGYDSIIAGKLIDQASAIALQRSRSGFSAGTVLGELRESINMVRHPANALRKLTEDYTRKVAVYRKEHLRRGLSHKFLVDINKALPDLYLELQFGWKPLASDIASGCDAIRNAVRDPNRVRFSGTASTQVTLPLQNVASYNNFPTSAYRLKVDRLVIQEYSAKVAGAASIKLGFGMPAFQAGSTIPDIIPSLWNCAPWSFLFDYFGNVGQVLEAQATASLLKVNFGYTNVKVVNTTVNDVYFQGAQKATFGSKSVHFQRRKLSTGFPIPAISFDKRPSDGQSMNIAALVASKAAEYAYRTIASKSGIKYTD